MGLVDIHNHVLPGIDDGPRDLDGSLRLLRAAWETGVRRIVATPHRFLPPWENASADAVRASYESFQTDIRARARHADFAFLAEMRIDLGAEHHLSDQLLLALERQELLPLNGSQYVLVELPSYMAVDSVIAAARLFLNRGLRPVIAHVERTSFFGTSSSNRTMARLVETGCVLQVNAESILGSRKRRSPQAQCLDLIREGLVRIVASDAHSTRTRRPLLDAALAVLREELPEQHALAVVRDHPAAVLDGRLLT